MSKIDHCISHYVVTSDLARIHCVESGPKDGVLVVLVHGWPDFHYGWRHQINYLAALGLHVVALDLRGCGFSSKPEKVCDYTFKRVSEDIVEIIAYFKQKRAILVGHDWGGSIVWACSIFFPESVIAVASLCTPFRPPTSKYTSPMIIARKFPMYSYQIYFASGFASEELDKDVKRTISIIYQPAGNAYERKLNEAFSNFSAISSAIVASKASARNNLYIFGKLPKEKIPCLLSEDEISFYFEAFKHGFEHSLNYYKTSEDNWKDLSNSIKNTKNKTAPILIDCPALIILATKDSILTPELSHGMEEWIPFLQREYIEASHWVHVEKFNEVNVLLSHWIGNIVGNVLRRVKL